MQFFDPIARVALEALVDNLIQGVALCLVVALLLRATAARTNAATRLAVWRMTLGALLFLLVIDLGRSVRFERPSPEGVHPAGLPTYAAPAAASRLEPGPLPPASAVAVVPRPVEENARFPLRLAVPAPWPGLLFLGLLALACTLVGRIVWSYGQLHRLKARSASLRGFEERLRHWRDALGVRRPVRLCASPEVSSPLLAGLNDPVILFPAGMVKTLTRTEVDYVILHELFHLRRRDDWSHALQLLAEALFFFHPAVRWIGRQLRIEQEMRCDDWVIALTGPVRPYATCLTKLARIGSHAEATALATGTVLRKHEISRRIEAMLGRISRGNPRFSYPGFLAIAWGPVLLASLLIASSPLASLAQAPLPGAGAPVVKQASAVPSSALAAARPSGGSEKEIEQGLREKVYGLPTESARVDYLLKVGPDSLERPALHDLYVRALSSVHDPRSLDRLLSGLLHERWLSKQARQTVLAAARSGFDSEVHLARFMAREAEYFTGEPELRQEYDQIAEGMTSEEGRQILLSRQAKGAWARRTTEGSNGTSEWVYQRTGQAPVAAPGATALDGRHLVERPAPAQPQPQAAAADVHGSDLPKALAALRSSSPEERASAAFALGQMRQGAASAVPSLIALLTDDTPVERSSGATSQRWGASFESKAQTSPAEEAAKALVYIGKPAREALEKAVSGGRAADSDKARWALGLVSQFD